jgi:hypothetical protein
LEAPPISELDSNQLQKVRIELLERGFDPGFDPSGENQLDGQLMGALAEFQSDYGLPVTGQPDVATLAMFGISTT